MKNLIAQNNTKSIGSIKPINDGRNPIDESGDFLGSLETYIGDIIGAITILATLFFIVYAFLAAFEWITSGGDSGKVAKAKDRLIWSTLGLILMVAAYMIVGLIGSLVGIDILNPADLINSITPGGSN
jgi:hypothetical protein